MLLIPTLNQDSIPLSFSPNQVTPVFARAPNGLNASGTYSGLSQAKNKTKKMMTTPPAAIAGAVPSVAPDESIPLVGSVVDVVLEGGLLVATADVTINHLVSAYPLLQTPVIVRLSSTAAGTLNVSHIPQLAD